jgi:hypothetical protein
VLLQRYLWGWVCAAAIVADSGLELAHRRQCDQRRRVGRACVGARMVALSRPYLVGGERVSPPGGSVFMFVINKKCPAPRWDTNVHKGCRPLRV